jgi:hypothetical protein
MASIKMDTVVGEGGKVELTVPLPAGTPIEVLVMDRDSDDFRDLIEATQSSLDFWDNAMDDEDWNAALPR